MSALISIIAFFIAFEVAQSRNQMRPNRHKQFLQDIIEIQGRDFQDQNIANQSFKIWAQEKDRQWTQERKRNSLDRTLCLESAGYKFPWYRFNNPEPLMLAKYNCYFNR